MTNRERFIEAYITAALWSSTDDNGRPLDNGEYDLSSEARTAMEREAGAFYDAHSLTIEGCDLTSSRSDNCEAAGHDFWFTRVGHGVGFWDGDWPEPYAGELDRAAKAAGSRELYVGDNGEIYQL